MTWERGLFIGLVASMGALAGMAGRASASTIDLAFTSVNPGQTVRISTDSGVNSHDSNAGQFNFTASNPTGNSALIISPGNLTTWCIEIGQFVTTSTITYSVLGGDPIFDNYVAPYSGPKNVQVTAFFNKHFSTSFTSDQAAAFQLGIWELTQDTSGGAADLTTGTFRADSSVSTSAFNLAQTWLGDYVGATGPYAIYQLHAEGNQDQIFAARGAGAENPTPLPAALPAGLTLIGAMGLFAKLRRKARS